MLTGAPSSPLLSLFTECVLERALGRDDLLEPVWWAREPDGKMAKGPRPGL